MTDSDQVLELQDADDDKNLTLDEEDTLLDEDDGEGEDDLQNFLTENKLQEHHHLFKEQQIDFETLLLLTETDLKSLNLPLGPFRKLVTALQKRRDAKGSEEVDGEDKNDEHNEGGSGKEDSDLAPLVAADGNSFTVVDESGEDSGDEAFETEMAEDKKEDDEVDRPDKPVVFDKRHPYYYDLKTLKRPEHSTSKSELTDPKPVESRKYEVVDDERGVRSMTRKLRKKKQIAIEYKFAENGYNEHTMLFMQISTDTTDFIVDFSKLRPALILLTDVLINSEIVKVFYDAKAALAHLQSRWNLFVVNSFSIREAAKELKYDPASLYGLLNKYTSYIRPSTAECAVRPVKKSIRTTLAKETNYLLHIYFKVKNELIEAGLLDKVLAHSYNCETQLQPLNEPGKPETIFSDYKMFNSAQKKAADDIYAWRESVSRVKDLPAQKVLPIKSFRELILVLPTNKDDVITLADTNFVRLHVLKLVSILKNARNQYDKDKREKDKYPLSNMPSPKKTESLKTPDTKRRRDTSPSPIVKRSKTKFKPNFDRPSPKTKSPFKGGPKKSPFVGKNSGGFRTGKPAGSPYGGGQRGGPPPKFQGGSVWVSNPPGTNQQRQGFNQNQGYNNSGYNKYY